MVDGFAQSAYALKIEVGYLKYQYNTIQVEPGPGWKGYNLEDVNGIDINVINGISIKEKLFAGVGLGYLNFQGIHGFSVYSDFEYLPLNTKLNLLINLKIGYSHVWNQYENGTGTALVEPGLGLNYTLSPNLGIYIKTGFLITQQSLIWPIRLGFRF